LAASTDRSVAISLLRSVDRSDPDVRAAVEQVLDLVEGSRRPADRTTRPGHLTGSAFVLSADHRSAILLFHRKLSLWLQPGGHADGDTNLAAVALREATEETGIEGLRVDPTPVDVDVHEVRPPGEDPHLHLDVRFLVVAPPGAVPVGNDESEEVRWVSVDELGEWPLDAGLRRLAAAALRRVRQSG
jgi:8-oxo-dGTP pyrophosphatase MutT (NUDIX family)